MGLAASQARFLGLTARKTNVEYQGQQINQQRTALANQSAGLFNQMLALKVPTPPLATNFAKTEYVFTDPSTSQKISLESIYKNPVVDGEKETYTVSGYTKSASILSNVSSITASGSGSNKYEFEQKDDGGYAIKVNGGIGMTVSEAKKYNSHIEAFNTADENSGDSARNSKDDYFFKFTNSSTGIEYYIPAEVNEDGTVQTLEELANSGVDLKLYSAESYTKSVQFHCDDAVVTNANDGTGRFDSITFYSESQREADGTPKEGETPITCKLTQQTTQDDEAFDAATATYNAEKAIYDKTVAEIDAQTATIQQQDKTLELHLEQLDTEQQAIQTEIEAIKKVIDKNIDETFKTFA